MQTYDLIMVLVLAGATIFGFWKGMAWQIASLASLFVSYVASLKFSAQLAPSFASLFGLQPPLDRFAAMLAIYVGASFFIWTLFRFVSKAIDKVRLQAFDKQIGAMFGFAKGVLLCVAITFFAVTLMPPAQGEAIVASKSGHVIAKLLDKAHTVFPPELHQVLDPYLNKIEQKLNPNFQPHGQDMQSLWQGQAQSIGLSNLPQVAWPQMQQPSQPNAAWPSQTQPQTAWPAPSQIQIPWPTSDPSQPATANGFNPYAAPREPQPFPGPYSAEIPASRDY
jgi:membrane protein required for colicin V production